MPTPTSFKNVELEQQVCYGFTTELAKGLEEWQAIEKYAWILHDKDIKPDGSPKEPHIHFMIQFHGAMPTLALLKYLGNISPDTFHENQLQKIKSWKGAIAYLTHANTPQKYQYSDEEVHTNLPKEEYDETKREGSVAVNDKVRLEQIINDIDNDILTEYNIDRKIPLLDRVKFNTQIKVAFESHYKKNRSLNRDMKVYFVTGLAGSGKTTLAKQLALLHGYDTYITNSGAHPFDNYMGEECMILDDIRPSDMKFNELLKVLDNNTSSMVHARYADKYFYRCKLCIITSTLPLDQWYKNLQESDGEAKSQLTRRITAQFTIQRFDKITGEILFKDIISGKLRAVTAEFISKEEERDPLDELDGITIVCDPKLAYTGTQSSIRDAYVTLAEDADLPF